ncbi:MAG: translation initiation factor IF-2 [Planctomycetes bacterium]|nr:translation initiation factor IF-2 [Planctomycetota bacterium]
MAQESKEPSTVRIYQLARELGIHSKILVERCRDEGIEVKSHMSAIDEPVAARFRKEFGPSAAAAPKARAEKPAASAAQPKAQSRAGSATVPPRSEARASATPVAARPPAPKPQVKQPPPPVIAGSPEEAAPEEGASQGVLPATMKAAPPPGREEEEILPGSHRSYRLQNLVTSTYQKIRKGPRTQQVQQKNFRTRSSRRPRGRPEVVHVAPQGPAKHQKFTLTAPISVRDLSNALGIKQSQIIRDLLKHEILATINDVLDADQVLALALDYEIEVEFQKEADLGEQAIQEMATQDKPEDLSPRAPVVTFLGHVDHGKTSLLDRILHTNVAAGESGGITQRIAAHAIDYKNSRVVFLDTPGHEAFTAMRARGANVTDVAVLVVAADDGVMPQTQEAIDHARAANVPIVVALNKIDRPNAKPERVLQQLAGLGLQPEEWGGQTIVVRTSALTGDGVENLLEMLVLQAEILELKANPKKPASGTVLDAERTEGRGVEATVLIQEGTIERGDCFICGESYGRVRSLFDDRDHSIRSAGPSTPVKVTGLSQIPEASSRFYCVKDVQTARMVAADRSRRFREASRFQRKHITLENLRAHLNAQASKDARFILKVDVQGSLEVLVKAIQDLAGAEIAIRILHSGVGGINESDVLLADASDAIVIGFNVVPDERARALAEDRGVSIRVYQVIYQAIEEIKAGLEGLLEPEEREKVTGHAEVRRIFSISKVGNIAGCYLRDGVIARNSRIRLVRDGVIVHEGRLSSLKRVKDDVREVREGLECGIKIEGYEDVKVADIIEAFEIEKIARTLSSTP